MQDRLSKGSRLAIVWISKGMKTINSLNRRRGLVAQSDTLRARIDVHFGREWSMRVSQMCEQERLGP